MIKKVVETWHRVVADERLEAPDDLRPIVAESDQWSVTKVVQQHERDATIAKSQIPVQISEGHPVCGAGQGGRAMQERLPAG